MIDKQTVRKVGKIIDDINYKDSDWFSCFIDELDHHLSQRELGDLTIVAFHALNKRHRFIIGSVIKKIVFDNDKD